MSDIVIQAENLGKHNATRPSEAATWPCATSTQSFRHLPFEEVWALKDVSFEVRRGAFAPKYGIIETRTS